MCTLLGAGVLLGLVAFANSEVSTSCLCDHFCFQEQLDNADIVARVRVKDETTSPVYGYKAYKMKLKKAFKNVSGYVINKLILLTHEDCPAIFEPKGEALLLAGQVYHDYYTYDTYIWVRDCDVNVPWSSFNRKEKKMIKKGKSFTYCDNNPCMNGGTCTEKDNEQCYICECAAGYEGLNCDCDDYCDFDDDICGWTQGYDDNFDWWRLTGPTSSFYTGPSNDHPTGNEGSYIYIEATDYQYNAFADLISPLFTPTCNQDYCFTFVYNMRGPHVEILEIFLYIPGDNVKTLLWEESGNQGNQWHTAGVGFSTDQPFQIVIRGTIGSSFMSDIAVDNVCLKLGEC